MIVRSLLHNDGDVENVCAQTRGWLSQYGLLYWTVGIKFTKCILPNVKTSSRRLKAGVSTHKTAWLKAPAKRKLRRTSASHERRARLVQYDGLWLLGYITVYNPEYIHFSLLQTRMETAAILFSSIWLPPQPGVPVVTLLPQYMPHH
jgi:hypothetical protein